MLPNGLVHRQLWTPQTCCSVHTTFWSAPWGNIAYLCSRSMSTGLLCSGHVDKSARLKHIRCAHGGHLLSIWWWDLHHMEHQRMWKVWFQFQNDAYVPLECTALYWHTTVLMNIIQFCSFIYPFSAGLKTCVDSLRLGFSVQWECVHSLFTPGSTDSAVGMGFPSLGLAQLLV